MTTIGLGCSRFGSLVGGTDAQSARGLVEAALDMGVRHFDTADIYGQGDSERFLGRLLASTPDAVITTKAGQRFPLAKRLVLTAKPILKPLMDRRAGLTRAAAASRAGLLPQDWSRRHLEKAIVGSLRRLRRETVDNFLLHSPSADVLGKGDAMDHLVSFKDRGMARRVGVSIDDAAAFEAALADSRVEVVQLPLQVLLLDPRLEQKAMTGEVELIVRELFAGRTDHDVDAAMGSVPKGVSVALVGTGNPDHLRQAHDAMAKARSC